MPLSAMACNMLSALISYRTASEKKKKRMYAKCVEHTGVDKLALRVQVVEGQEEMPQTTLQQRCGEAATWIPV